LQFFAADARRFFQYQVLARVERQDGLACVQIVRHAFGYDIHGLIIEKFLITIIDADRLFRLARGRPVPPELFRA